MKLDGTTIKCSCEFCYKFYKEFKLATTICDTCGSGMCDRCANECELCKSDICDNCRSNKFPCEGCEED